MLHIPSEWLNILKPNFKVLPLKERLLCGIGALLGLAISSLISWYVLGSFNAWYIAPMGASSVLLFAVSASPLAQPWNMMVGNFIAGLIGVACAIWIHDATLAFSLAVGLSIILMMSVDALHPPSGAIAMTAVLGGDAVHDLGFAFVAYPVLLNSALLLLFAVVFNRLLGRQYPQVPQLNQRSNDPTPTQRVTIQPKDIQYALEQQTKLLDISQYDLENLILDAQQHANQRLKMTTKCVDIMTKDVAYIDEKDQIVDVLEKFKHMNIMSLPVLDEQKKLVGTLALSDIVAWFKQSTEMRFAWQDQVKYIMQTKVVTVKPEQNIVDLIPLFVEKSFNYVPVIDEDEQLLGMISRADMIAVLYQYLLQKEV